MNRVSRILFVLIVAFMFLGGTALIVAQTQTPAQPSQSAQPAKAKESETDLYTAWYNEKDPAKKVDIAKKYLELYPKGQYASYMEQTILQYKFSQFQTAFKNHNDADLFKIAKDFLASPPAGIEPITFLYWPALESQRMTMARDFSMEADGRDFTTKCITEIEAGKIPAMVQDKTAWAGGQKNKVLGLLYQNLGLMDVHDKNNDQAVTELQKALSYDDKQPYTAFQLGLLYQDRYNNDLAKYNAITDQNSPEAKAQLDVLHADEDAAIDALGRFLALTDGMAQWTSQRANVQPVLDAFWKERHPDDPNGSQKAVDKYKNPQPTSPTAPTNPSTSGAGA